MILVDYLAEVIHIIGIIVHPNFYSICRTVALIKFAVYYEIFIHALYHFSQGSKL